MRSIFVSMSLAALLLAPAAAAANTPDAVSNSSATLQGGPLTLRMSPARTAPSIGDLGAAVHVEIRNADDQPIASFPLQDLWLDDVGDGSITLCAGGSVADANTDADGQTTITGAIAGGGSSEAGLYLYVVGTPLQQDLLDIAVNSADLDGNLVVDLSDLAAFATDFANGYAFRSDLAFDGELDLSDLGVFSIHYGETCP
jgi:hypothetical protein